MSKIDITVQPYKTFAVFNGLVTFLGLNLLTYDKKTDLHKFSYIKLIYHMFVLVGIVYLAFMQITHFYPRGEDHDIGFILVVYYPKTAGHLMTLLVILSFSINSIPCAKMLNSKYFVESINKLNRSQLKRSYTRQLFVFVFFTVIYIGSEILTSRQEENFILRVLGSNDFTIYNVATTAQYHLSITSLIMLVQFLNERLKKIKELSMDLASERKSRKNKNSEEKELRRSVQIFYMTINDQKGINESTVIDSSEDKVC